MQFSTSFDPTAIATYKFPGLVNCKHVIKTCEDKANITDFLGIQPDRTPKGFGDFLYYSLTLLITIQDVEGRRKKTIRPQYDEADLKRGGHADEREKILDTYYEFLYNTLNAEAQSGMIGQVQIQRFFRFLTAGCLQKTKGFRVIQKDNIMTCQTTTVTLGIHIQALAFSHCCSGEAHLHIIAAVIPHSRKASNDLQKSITFQKLKHLTTRIKSNPSIRKDISMIPKS